MLEYIVLPTAALCKISKMSDADNASRRMR